ncbi:MAG: hypothetical protein HC923_02315 [Myxococcales bacterium]|nr:hypothetical protein [Myxococcales bacterium]
MKKILSMMAAVAAVSCAEKTPNEPERESMQQSQLERRMDGGTRGYDGGGMGMDGGRPMQGYENARETYGAGGFGSGSMGEAQGEFDRQFVQQATSGGLFEVASSQWVIGRMSRRRR